MSETPATPAGNPQDGPSAPPAPARKSRATTPTLYAVVQANGSRAFYRATSTTQAGAFHNEATTIRRATTDEILEIGRRGLAIGGIPSAEPEPETACANESQPASAGPVPADTNEA